MMPQVAQMHEAIGRAVLAAQVFEAVFVVCVRLRGMVARGVGFSIEPEHFKVGTRNLIKELLSANEIAPEFEEEINDLVEKRHTLIHRWYTDHGIPGAEDATDIAQLTRLAREVEHKSRRISTMLAGYIIRWGKANPEQSVLIEPERSRLLAMFQRAHLGDPGN